MKQYTLENAYNDCSDFHYDGKNDDVILCKKLNKCQNQNKDYLLVNCKNLTNGVQNYGFGTFHWQVKVLREFVASPAPTADKFSENSKASSTRRRDSSKRKAEGFTVLELTSKLVDVVEKTFGKKRKENTPFEKCVYVYMVCAMWPFAKRWCVCSAVTLYMNTLLLCFRL
uniref:Uncharacterized protein n=1 Tax=Glossina austeni TaxID=7395 RepID=A0A1A9VLM8_GLOAU